MSIDPLVITALVTSVTSMLVSVLTHVRYSKCFNCELETRDSGSIQEPEIRSRSRSSPTDMEPRSRSNSREREPLLSKDEINISPHKTEQPSS